MQRGKGPHQRKAEAGTFLAADMLTLHLFERFAQPFEIGGGNADAGIGHRDFDAAGPAHRADPHLAPARGEFDAVGNEVDQNLLHRAAIGIDKTGIGGHRRLQRDAFPFGRHLHEAQGLARDIGKIDQFFRQFEFAGLDLRHVEHAIDQFEQMAARFMNEAGIFDIARAAERAEHFMRHHFGEADDRIQRCAQFMTHIGEETGFGAVRLLRLVAGLDQFAFMRLAFGNIARHRHDIGRGAVLRRRRAATDFRPQISTVAALQPHFGAGGTAEIARFDKRRLHDFQIVGMDECGRHQTADIVRPHAQHRFRRGAGIADGAIRPVAGDHVHRIVGEEAIHRRPFGQRAIGGALPVLRRGGDQGRLHHRGQNRDRIKFPFRQRQPRGRQITEPLHRRDQNQCHRGRETGAQNRRPVTGQGCFRRDQHEPHHQRGREPARQRGEVTDQGREQRERGRFQRFGSNLRKAQPGKNGGRQKAGHGDGFTGAGRARQRHENQRQHSPQPRFRGLYQDEAPALEALVLRGACDDGTGHLRFSSSGANGRQILTQQA